MRASSLREFLTWKFSEKFLRSTLLEVVMDGWVEG